MLVHTFLYLLTCLLIQIPVVRILSWCHLLVVSARLHAQQVFVQLVLPVKVYSLCKVIGYRDWMLSARGL